MGAAVNATSNRKPQGRREAVTFRVESLPNLFRQLLPYDQLLTELIFRH